MLRENHAEQYQSDCCIEACHTIVKPWQHCFFLQIENHFHYYDNCKKQPGTLRWGERKAWFAANYRWMGGRQEPLCVAYERRGGAVGMLDTCVVEVGHQYLWKKLAFAERCVAVGHDTEQQVIAYGRPTMCGDLLMHKVAKTALSHLQTLTFVVDSAVDGTENEVSCARGAVIIKEIISVNHIFWLCRFGQQTEEVFLLSRGHIDALLPHTTAIVRVFFKKGRHVDDTHAVVGEPEDETQCKHTCATIEQTEVYGYVHVAAFVCHPDGRVSV